MQKQFSDLVNAVIPLLPITKKAQVEDYVQCLMRFYQYLLRKSKKYKRGNCAAAIHDNPAIGLRFLAELENLGFIKVPRAKEGRKLVAYIVPTTFLNSLLTEHEPFKNTIRYPIKVEDCNKNYQVRIKSEVVSIIKNNAVDAISSTVFTINSYILYLLEEFPVYSNECNEFISYYRTITEARKYLGRKFRFPYFLDSRGRVYNEATVGFSPQGADHEKALILPTFKEVLTENGLIALREAAHGYSEIKWSDSTMIQFARHPERYRDEWIKADKPYCFMSCANILMQYYDNPKKPLPAFTPLDGRCSGLQHWSAMLGTNAITNRLGMEENEASDGLDIYEFVASEWKNELEQKYKYLVSRKLCKKPVMTFAYSATRMSSMDNIHDMIGEVTEWKEGKWKVVKEGLPRFESARLGSNLFDKTNQILQPIVTGVDYLKKCIKIIMLKTDNPDVVWATHDGFEGLQHAYKKNELKVQVEDSLGKRHTVILQVPQLDIFGQKIPSITKAQSGIGPNFIHSLDATHLRMVARRLKLLNLPAIWIHDSFAVHSNYREVLYNIIVEEFIKLYSRNHLQLLKDLWEQTYNVELPEVPKKGNWDIKTLKKCKRFFE